MAAAARAVSLFAGLCLAAAASPAAAGAIGDPCAGRSDVLGVSRIVEIDTTSAPKFGAQYGNASFLEDGEVVLTFDDGPLRHYTQRVIDALDTQCAKATFFIVGRMAIADPDMLKTIAKRGHTIGIHTWSHKKLPTLSASKAEDEIELGLSATAKALDGQIAPFFRFPYLRDNRSTIQHLAERNIGVFGIDVDSRDFATRDPAMVQRAVLAQLKTVRKGIILFHDIQPSTAGSMKALLAALKAQGYRLVHMIPKTPLTTLPKYDDRAGKALAQKVIAGAKSPLAKRSVVWPAGGGTPETAVPVPPGTEEVLPWLSGDGDQSAPANSVIKPTISAKPSPRPKPAAPNDDPWQLQTMGN